MYRGYRCASLANELNPVRERLARAHIHRHISDGADGAEDHDAAGIGSNRRWNYRQFSRIGWGNEKNVASRSVNRIRKFRKRISHASIYLSAISLLSVNELIALAHYFDGLRCIILSFLTSILAGSLCPCSEKSVQPRGASGNFAKRYKTLSTRYSVITVNKIGIKLHFSVVVGDHLTPSTIIQRTWLMIDKQTRQISFYFAITITVTDRYFDHLLTHLTKNTTYEVFPLITEPSGRFREWA